MTETHARFSPSKLSRILACPGSVAKAEALPPGKSSAAADEGTLLHDFTAKSLMDRQQLFMVPKEHRGAVEDCCDYFDIVVGSCTSPMIYIEHKVVVCDNCWGTADVIIIDGASGQVHVIDWKFGRGVPVYADHNEQLMAYGAGALITFGHADAKWDVTLHVHQPRIDNSTKWVTTASYLVSWVNQVCLPTFHGIEANRPMPLVPDPEKQCRWCTAKMNCEAYIALVEDKAVDVFAAYAEKDVTTEDRLVALYRSFKALDVAMKAISDHLMSRALSGQCPTGLKLVRGKSSRPWVDEKAAAAWLLNHGYEVDDVYVSKLVTPAAAEKLSSKLKKNEEFTSLYNKAPGNPALVDESDKREPLHLDNNASEIFSCFVEK